MALGTDSLNFRHRATLSCLECHKRKKKCDRGLPCNQCSKTRKKRRCLYQEVQASELHVPRESLQPGDTIELPITTRPLQELWAADFVDDLFPKSILESEPGFPQEDNMMIALKSTSRNSSPYSASYLSPRDGLLMNNFLTLFRHRLNTFADASNVALAPKAADNWLKTATSHPATFYSLLYCGATMYADIVRKRYNEICPKSGCLPYKITAIRNINDSLANTATAVTDEMILAVLMLMNFDSAMETLNEYQVHLHGLRRMIELRGGLDALGYHGILKNWYLWCDRRTKSEIIRDNVLFKAITVLPGDV